MQNGRPRVLFVDAYDSFAYNIVSAVECCLGVGVTVIKIDEPVGDFASYVRPFSAVIAGPGPGHPSNPKDAGRFQELWSLASQDILPVLGICLGFQSLVLSHGGKILQLAEPRHGMLRKIRAKDESIFTGVQDVTAVQYHSLYGHIGDFVAEDASEDFFGMGKRFESFCPFLVPLAWDFMVDNNSENIGLQKNNPQAILMGVAHRTKPFYGVQFHPESICSDEDARNILPNWWALAQQWNSIHRPRHHSPRAGPLVASIPRDVGDAGPYQVESNTDTAKPKPNGANNDSLVGLSCMNQAQRNGNGHLDRRYESNDEPPSFFGAEPSQKLDVIAQTVDFFHLTVPNVCEKLGLQSGEVVVLDSECNQNTQTGKHSIIGIIDADTVKLEYNIGQSYVRRISQYETAMIDLAAHGGSIFAYLKYFIGQRTAGEGPSDVPFWGGLMGYISYEACLETLDIKSTSNPVDLSFAYVERSLVINHQQGVLHVQSTKRQDHDWVASVTSVLSKKVTAQVSNGTLAASTLHTAISLPGESVYRKNIRDCFDLLRKGESYELCLTTECKVRMPKALKSWALFCRLRKKNAAPFAAYVRLGPLTHLASSPERFMSWSRPAREKQSQAVNGYENGHTKEEHGRMSSTFQFRPIKGTVKKQPKDRTLPALSLEEATAILSTPKERAENLMIVDLIRHDLHSVVGSGNVNVSKLMVVEEYATLYQLVSVIEGTLYLDDSGRDPDYEEAIDTADNGHIPRGIKQSSTSRENGPKKENGHHLHQPQSAAPKTPVHASRANINGIDVLAASLPPGSMTGAPKRRACSLLQQIEHRNRGIYSGVLGYLDIGGGGDFSVVIRSASKWDTPHAAQRPLTSHLDQNGNTEHFEKANSVSSPSSSSGAHNEQSESQNHSSEGASNGPSAKDIPLSNGDHHTHPDMDGLVSDTTERDTWTIGAGGAVTCLSTEQGEWDEMYGKLSSTLAAFIDDEFN